MLLSHLKIEGHSMEPAIFEGQSVLASSIPLLLSKLKAGDIVVFENYSKLIVKRIKGIKGDRLLVYGDNKLDSRDFGSIKKKKILGKVIWIFGY